MMKKQSFFIETYPIWLLASIKIALHFWVNVNDGIFRDELYYLACGNRLDFGYVDHPPFVALVAALSLKLFGDSVFAIRLFPTLAGAGVIVLTGFLTREMGGNRFAQFLAGLSVLLAPLFLGIHGFLSMNVFDHLSWLIALCLLALIARKDCIYLWALLGVVLGV
ncbi:glycosyltransferase, partial [bacterium]|nr:glycosyltransferase [bacterium]